MNQEINFINVVGGTIPDYISEMLSLFAIQMYQDNNPIFEFEGEDFAGVMMTDFRKQRFVVIDGIRFQVELYFEDENKLGRSVKSNFLVEKDVLLFNYSEGYNFTTNDIEEVYFPVDEETAEILSEILVDDEQLLS